MRRHSHFRFSKGGRCSVIRVLNSSELRRVRLVTDLPLIAYQVRCPASSSPQRRLRHVYVPERRNLLTLVNPGGAFAALRAHFANPRIVEQSNLLVVLRSGDKPTRFSPAETHQALYGDHVDSALAVLLWRSVIQAAQDDDTPDSRWQLLLIWLAVPRLARTARQIAFRLRASQPDLESEMVLALLERLPTVDCRTSEAIDQLARAARSRAWHYARSVERPVAPDRIDAIAGAERQRPGPDDDDEGEAGCVVEITPPPGPSGLNASIRFTQAPAHIDSARLGWESERLRLHSVIRQANHRGRRKKVGTCRMYTLGRRP